MKKINILMIGILFFISACEKQQNEFFLNSHDASLVALDYLLLSDNQYVLNLSQDDAAILGISEFDYKRILQEINNANDEILKHKNDACFIIANPEELHKNEQNIGIIIKINVPASAGSTNNNPLFDLSMVLLYYSK